MQSNFEDFLQDKFMELREIGGMPITKDNCEDLFESWLWNLDRRELIDFADEYHKQTVEKLIEEIPDTIGHTDIQGFGIGIKQKLRAKWLGGKNE